ncbi:hypothetical protein Vadar_015247 [Vaccinium darrowii]|uniref:Uncharacterized protein n=1 Tax=Vaccinium darrowii TaxID=229202 RepID=A0ACB7YVP4_9ERIC|nr:hypothetical protein Vadar_015247 [Vaccinium darrowii]
MDDEDDLTVADLEAPYWERPVSLDNEQQVKRITLLAQQMKRILLLAQSNFVAVGVGYVFYLIKVPVRVAGGLLFGLLGQSAGDPFVEEDDITITFRSWQTQNFLIIALHVKGPASQKSRNNYLRVVATHQEQCTKSLHI